MKKIALFAFSLSAFIVSGTLLTGCLDGSSSSSPACGDSFCLGTILALDDVAGSLVPGIELAQMDINSNEGNLVILSRDSEFNTETAKAAVDELLNLGVNGIVGAYSSHISLSIIDDVAGNGNVLISPANTSPVWSEYNMVFAGVREFPRYYRTAPSDRHQAALMARQIGEDGGSPSQPQSVVIIHRDDNGGTRFAELLTEDLEENANTMWVGTISFSHQNDPAVEDQREKKDIVNGIIADLADLPADYDAIVFLDFTVRGAEILELLLMRQTPQTQVARFYLGEVTFGQDEDTDARLGALAIDGVELKLFIPAGDPQEKEAFETRLRELNPAAQSFIYAAQAYDAVVLLELARLAAGSSDPDDYVKEIIAVSRGGEKCKSYQACRESLIEDADADIDYDGISGPIDFDDNGDITTGFYDIYAYETGGLSPSESITTSVTAMGFVAPDTLSATPPDGSLPSSPLPACGNSFCIGTILALDHGATTLVPGLELAQSDINEHGGDITILSRNSELNPYVADSIVDEFLDAGVDGIIGAYSSHVSLSIVDKVVSNGNVLFSPSNTSPALSEYNLAFTDVRNFPQYYRTAPSDAHLVGLLVQQLSQDNSDPAPQDVIVIHRNDNWGIRLSELVQEEIEGDDSIMLTGVVPYSDSDEIDTIAEQVGNVTDLDDVDAVLFLDFAERASSVLEAILELPAVQAERFYLADASFGDDRIEYLAETYLITIKLVRATIDPNEKNNFEDRLRMIAPEQTEFVYAGQVYDALVLLELARLASGSSDPAEYVEEIIAVSRGGTVCETYSDCRDLLEGGTSDINYDGISGPIDFDDNGDITQVYYDINTYNMGMETDSTTTSVQAD